MVCLEVNYSEFQSEFGKGSIFVPEFLKPRSLRPRVLPCHWQLGMPPQSRSQWHHRRHRVAWMG